MNQASASMSLGSISGVHVTVFLVICCSPCLIFYFNRCLCHLFSPSLFIFILLTRDPPFFDYSIVRVNFFLPWIFCMFLVLYFFISPPRISFLLPSPYVSTFALHALLLSTSSLFFSFVYCLFIILQNSILRTNVSCKTALFPTTCLLGWSIFRHDDSLSQPHAEPSHLT